MKAIRRVFSWAIDSEHVTVNPARDLRRISNGSQGHHVWTLEEVEQFERRHPIGTKARLALAIMIYLGVRRSDAVLLGKQHVRDGWLKFTAQKGRNRNPVTMELPILPQLQTIVDASPTGDLTYLLTEYGKPFTANGFGGWFRARCDEAGLPQCSAHGLRKAGATIAAENGASSHTLMSIFGWRSLDQAELYTRTAERKRLAGEGMSLLVRKSKLRT